MLYVNAFIAMIFMLYDIDIDGFISMILMEYDIDILIEFIAIMLMLLLMLFTT